MSYTICQEDLPLYDSNLCEVDKSAAISKVAYIKRGQTTITDFEDPTQWTAAIAAGDVRISGDLSADLPDGSPVTIDNKRACGSATVQVAVDYTVTIIDPNVSEENDTFYSGINGKSYDIVIFYCAENQVRLLPNGNVSARIPQSVGNQTETQHYNITVNFRYKNTQFGTLYDAPAGIFE
jgi:hypothetical protein